MPLAASTLARTRSGSRRAQQPLGHEPVVESAQWWGCPPGSGFGACHGAAKRLRRGRRPAQCLGGVRPPCLRPLATAQGSLWRTGIASIGGSARCSSGVAGGVTSQVAESGIKWHRVTDWASRSPPSAPTAAGPTAESRRQKWQSNTRVSKARVAALRLSAFRLTSMVLSEGASIATSEPVVVRLKSRSSRDCRSR